MTFFQPSTPLFVYLHIFSPNLDFRFCFIFCNILIFFYFLSTTFFLFSFSFLLLFLLDVFHFSLTLTLFFYRVLFFCFPCLLVFLLSLYFLFLFHASFFFFWAFSLFSSLLPLLIYPLPYSTVSHHSFTLVSPPYFSFNILSFCRHFSIIFTAGSIFFGFVFFRPPFSHFFRLFHLCISIFFSIFFIQFDRS